MIDPRLDNHKNQVNEIISNELGGGDKKRERTSDIKGRRRGA